MVGDRGRAAEGLRVNLAGKCWHLLWLPVGVEG